MAFGQQGFARQSVPGFARQGVPAWARQQAPGRGRHLGWAKQGRPPLPNTGWHPNQPFGGLRGGGNGSSGSGFAREPVGSSGGGISQGGPGGSLTPKPNPVSGTFGANRSAADSLAQAMVGHSNKGRQRGQLPPGLQGRPLPPGLARKGSLPPGLR